MRPFLFVLSKVNLLKAFRKTQKKIWLVPRQITSVNKTLHFCFNLNYARHFDVE